MERRRFLRCLTALGLVPFFQRLNLRAQGPTATLLLKPSLPCKVFIDDEEAGDIESCGSLKLPATLGQHAIKAIARDDSNITWNDTIQISESAQRIVQISFRKKCATCRGSAQVKCNRCSNGMVKCDKCLGNKRITCPRCKGSGRAVCTYCSGSGRNNSGGTCIFCEGAGKVTCEYEDCEGSGKIFCPKCGEEGQLICPKCGGTSRLECDTCAGTGRVAAGSFC